MSAREEILAGTYKDTAAGVAALRAAGGTSDVDKLFASFVGYASVHWNYAAQSGKQTAEDLLDGEGTKNVACGTLRSALIILLRDMQLKVNVVDLNDRFLSKPSLSCFDPKVKGNVGDYGSAIFDAACHFSSHYFLETGGKYYDPCLMATYSNSNGPIGHKTSLVLNSGPDWLRKVGSGRSFYILKLVPAKTVPGFGEVWHMLTPAECKIAGVLTAKQMQAVKADPDVMAGKLL